MNGTRVLVLVQIVAALVCVCASAAPALGSLQGSEAAQLRQRFDPAQDVGIDQNLGQSLPLDVVMRTESGSERTLGSLLAPGKPVLLALVYYECPMLCGMVEEAIVDALKRTGLVAGRDFSVIFASIDPTETSDLAAAKKASLLEAFGPGAEPIGWHCLTGNQAAIDRLAVSVGFRYVYDEAIGEYAHAGGFMIAQPTGILSHYFFGAAYEAPDVRLALVDASQGKIGTLKDRVLLLCYHWNAAAGRYGMAILGATRALGFVTVLIIAAWILRAFRRGHAAQGAP